ncbi:uncharacterized protein (TIGR00297 family) [Paenibacillus sediminis]|uniref:Uncharacterized protein (TIGR00297 family) n=1 Tax=Paenibacillus sediminis TaxID=664909 RepID=A0ABS4H5J9_9BACL|nr:DUF92 domain-containing protein [Paenibacillus sediminis]MBP1937766.1 uncharacterized protein (TIGR00297 family) [Paenibacillus sediminis]
MEAASLHNIIINWLIGAACAFIVAGAAYFKRSLTLSGWIAATFMGMVYYGAGSLFWFGILLVFFISSTLLSKLKQSQKSDLEGSYAKTGRRDAGQVFANGGIGMLLCLTNFIWPHPAWGYLFVGVMATVTSDTWATEVGSLSRKAPRSILTWKRVSPGASGGISTLGTWAAAAGGLLIGLSAWTFDALTDVSRTSLWLWLVIGLIGGLVGAFTDSFLGATVQLMYRCQICEKEVEVAEHCGVQTHYHRGHHLMTNDAVNLLSSIAGAIAGIVLGSLLG